MTTVPGSTRPPVVTFIGGGSHEWGHILLRDLFSSPELAGTEVRLHDINRTAAREVLAMSHTLQKRAKSRLKVRVVDGLDRALDGTDYVIIAIAVGGLRELQHQIDIPAKFGCFQSVSQTTGPGMVVRTMINGPVFLDFARRMERLCPDAWILNFTNPLTTLGRIVTKNTKIQMVGICHGVWSSLGHFSKLLGVPKEQIQIHFAGVNHGSYIFDIRVKGVSVFEEVRRKTLARFEAARAGQDLEVDPLGHVSGVLCRLEVLKRLGVYASNSDRHHSEFYSYFLRDGGRRYRVRPTRAERRMAGLPYAREHTRKIAAGELLIPVEAGGEPANDIILARHFGKPYYGPVNLPNQGQVPNLPLGAIVETAGVIDHGGMRPVHAGPIPMEVLPYMLTQTAIHELAVEAAETGDPRKALAAVLADPLTRDWRSAPQMVEEMIYASRRFMPHPVKPLARPGRRLLTSRNAALARMAEMSDRCLVDTTEAFFKQAKQGARWDNPSMLTRERIELAGPEAARFGKLLDGAGRVCLDTALRVSAGYPMGWEDRRWFLQSTRAEGASAEFVIASDQEEIRTNEKGEHQGPGPFLNMYCLSAFAVTVENGRPGGLLRRGVYLRRYAAFAALDEARFATAEELADMLRPGMPEAVLQAGQKYFRLLDALTYDFGAWRRRLPPALQSRKLLLALRHAETDLQLCEALLLAGETRATAERHALERFAGQVYFALAQ